MRPIFPFFGMIALATVVAMAPVFIRSAVAQETKASRFAVPVAPAQAAALKREEDLAVGQAESAVREMRGLAKTQPEKALADSDGRIVAEIGRLVARRQAARSSGGGQGQAALLNATQQMQETQMSFNLQYLMLQNQVQNENRQFTAVSNVMKSKHDTVKNSISNIR